MWPPCTFKNRIITPWHTRTVVQCLLQAVADMSFLCISVSLRCGGYSSCCTFKHLNFLKLFALNSIELCERVCKPPLLHVWMSSRSPFSALLSWKLHMTKKAHLSCLLLFCFACFFLSIMGIIEAVRNINLTQVWQNDMTFNVAETSIMCLYMCEVRAQHFDILRDD